MKPVNRRQFIKSGVATAAATGAVAAPPQRPAGFRPPSQAGRGIKFGCSAALWTKGGRASLSDALAGIAAAGYEWVEADADDLWEYRERPTDFKKLLERHGLGLVTVTLSGNFADRDERLKNISRAVQIARALESLEAGFLVLESTGWGKIERQPRNYHIFSSNLGEIGALVYEETGLHTAYRFNEADAADVRKIIATSDSRYVKFCFDTQFLARLGLDPARMIRAYGPRMIHLHLHDGLARAGQWQDTPVGRGKVAMAAVLQALYATRYNGWANIQQEAAQGSAETNARESLKRVRTYLQTAERKVPAEAVADAATPDTAAGDAHAGHQQHPRRGGLQDLVVIGAP